MARFLNCLLALLDLPVGTCMPVPASRLCGAKIVSKTVMEGIGKRNHAVYRRRKHENKHGG